MSNPRPPLSLPPTITSLTLHMNTAVSSSSHSDGPFLPLLSSPRTRQPSATSTSSSNSSIWAPQPHSPGCIWPNSLLPLPSDRLRRPSPLRLRSGIPPSTHEPPLTVEDVFGSSEHTVPQMPRTVGAIGDGRRKAGPNYFSNVSPLASTKSDLRSLTYLAFTSAYALLFRTCYVW